MPLAAKNGPATDVTCFINSHSQVPRALLFIELTGGSQQVVLDGQASYPVPVLSGVPQGLVLGPIFFLIFINDLSDNIKSSVRLFWDDCVLYRNIHSLQDCLILQGDLDSLGLWEADWQMKFNVAKCHSMRVTRH